MQGGVTFSWTRSTKTEQLPPSFRSEILSNTMMLESCTRNLGCARPLAAIAMQCFARLPFSDTQGGSRARALFRRPFSMQKYTLILDMELIANSVNGNRNPPSS